MNRQKSPKGRPRSGWGLLRRAAIDTEPLRHADYRRLWLGQGVSFIGFQLTSVAVPVQVWEISRSTLWVGMLGPAALVPLVVFGLWGGTVADAMDRRLLLLTSSSVTWASTFGLLAQALLSIGNIWLMMGLVAVQSAGFAIASPTRNTIIPRLLPMSLVPAANTLNFVVSNSGMVLGPLVGGVAIDTIGFAGAYAIDAALFTCGLYAAFRLPGLPPRGGDITRPGLRSLVEGLRYISQHPVLIMSFVIDLLAMGLAMPRALFPPVARTWFPGSNVGWLYASIAIGAVVGGLFSGWIGRVRRQGTALVVAIMGWGGFVALAGIAGHLWLVVLLLALAGACDLVGSVYRHSILLTYAPDRFRGRLQGVFIVVVAGGPRLGDFRAGATASMVGIAGSWVGGGIACVISMIVCFLAVPALRRYRAPR